MRIYCFYFVTAITLLASAGAEAATRGIMRANNEFVFQLMNAFSGILH
ncbi:hypothetical protein [Herbaspirillum sp. YR522]|nr:hypothetical protein [Herbaspirillum sp. YR522]EJN08821.1 hypothetical protein PMI40_01082 [Herbaspirillum sp. YR522]